MVDYLELLFQQAYSWPEWKTTLNKIAFIDNSVGSIMLWTCGDRVCGHIFRNYSDFTT